MSERRGQYRVRRSLEERFWRRLEAVDWEACWEWCGAISSTGYGSIGWRDWSGGDGVTRHHNTHAYAYSLLVGPVPEGLQLDHTCRNKRCCNPAHLEPVTGRENILRGARGPQLYTHCVRGHEFTPENTYYVKTRPGRRICLACKREAGKRHHAKRSTTMARCSACQKFVPFDEPVVEVESFEETLEEDDHLTAEVSVTLPCGECGEELKQAILEISEPLPEHICQVSDVLKAMLKRGSTDPTPEEVDTEIDHRSFEVTTCEAEPFERVQETDSKGKKITNPRYAKHYYGAQVTWNATCSACGAVTTVTAPVEEQASSFEEVA